MTKIKGIITFVLRLIALASTIVATIVMGTAHDSASVLGIKFDAKFTNSPSFKYFVIAYAVVSFYSLVVLLLPFKNLLWRLILVLDMVVTLLLTSAASAALAIAYVGKKGNTHAGWLAICGQVPKFCDQTSAALAVGFVAAIIYFVLLLYSLHAALGPLFPAST
ncbi:CASP-like protein 1C3 [Chenopodium quinoa]|nr:CASP-like protein 1C3 [Chenopodium quinoa]